VYAHVRGDGRLLALREALPTRADLRSAEAGGRQDEAGPGHSQHDVVVRLSQKLLAVPGGILFAAEPPAIEGIGRVGGFQFILQDGGRNSFADIDRVALRWLGGARSVVGLAEPQHHLYGQRSPARR